jgi:hypothetical protein
VTVKGLDAGEELAVVSARDQDLGARADSGLKDGKRAGGELVLLDLRNFIFSGTKSALEMTLPAGSDTYVNSLRGFAISSCIFASTIVRGGEMQVYVGWY